MFKRPSVHYGRTPQPVTPYQKASQVWDDRIGSARIQARNWRLMAFGCLLLSGGLAAGLVWQSAQGTVTPWVVEVDHLGQAQAVTPASPFYQPTDPQIAFHLARFIEDVPPSHPPILIEPQLEAWGPAYLASDPGASLRLPAAVRIPNGPAADIAAAWSGNLAYDPRDLHCPVLCVRG